MMVPAVNTNVSLQSWSSRSTSFSGISYLSYSTPVTTNWNTLSYGTHHSLSSSNRFTASRCRSEKRDRREEEYEEKHSKSRCNWSNSTFSLNPVPSDADLKGLQRRGKKKEEENILEAPEQALSTIKCVTASVRRPEEGDRGEEEYEENSRSSSNRSNSSFSMETVPSDADLRGLQRRGKKKKEEKILQAPEQALPDIKCVSTGSHPKRKRKRRGRGKIFLDAPDHSLSSRKREDRIDAVMKMCKRLSSVEKLNTTQKSTMKGAGVIAGSAVVAGFFAGSAGLLVGGIVGSAVAYYVTKGTFKSFPEIIRELSPEQKQSLYYDVMRALGKTTWKNANDLTAKVMADPELTKKVKDTLIQYVNKMVQG